MSGELVQAADFSNWQAPDLTASIQANRLEHAVIRLGTEQPEFRTIARQQLTSAIDNGCSVSGYIWCDWAVSPEERTVDALSVASGFPLTMVWFDAEQGAPGNQLDDRLSRAVDLAERRGYRCGIYTNAGFWRVNGDSQGFTRLGLWLAAWNESPTLDDLDLPGGWTSVVGHQWSTTGGTLDRDVFDAALFPLPDPCATLKTALRAELAVLDGVRERIAALLA